MKTKKLFLASVVPFVMKRFLEFLPDSPKRLTMGFVATAGDPYADKWFVEEDRKKLIKAGFNLKEIDLKGKNIEYVKYFDDPSKAPNLKSFKLTNYQGIVVQEERHYLVDANV